MISEGITWQDMTWHDINFMKWHSMIWNFKHNLNFTSKHGHLLVMLTIPWRNFYSFCLFEEIRKKLSDGSHISRFLPPANKVCEGYVFRCICQSFCSQSSCSQHALQAVSQHALQVSRPTPRGGGSRGVWPGGSPGLHPWGVSRPTPGGVSRPTPRGSPGPHLGGLQANTEGGGSQHALRQTPAADGYCRWYTSYWNAFLFYRHLPHIMQEISEYQSHP